MRYMETTKQILIWVAISLLGRILDVLKLVPTLVPTKEEKVTAREQSRNTEDL